MRIIAGLGNPGEKYRQTPHNVGFDVVEALEARWSCKLKRSLRFRARICRTSFGGQDVMLVQPATFMNLSGEAVAPLMRYYNVPPADLIVVVDDADLDLGRIRIRASGSSGGHKGLESSIGATGSRDFPRVRMGIGRDAQGSDLVDHVLGRFRGSELELADRMVERAGDAVMCVLEKGLEMAMNEFNAKNANEDEKSMKVTGGKLC